MRKLALLGLAALFFAQTNCSAPPTFTADDWVPPYNAPFGFGVNLGYYPPFFRDEDLALLAHGSPDGAVQGVGVTTIRPSLPDHFLEYWGYDIRLPTFRFYDSIGLRDNVVFLGFPAPQHRDSTFYCPEARSTIFKNIYEPIWDDGAHGTPVNDDNPFALYVWKTVSRYGKSVRFWEIWNEPDLDMKGNGWKPASLEGNWWTNVPGPCETQLRAPVFSYIRMLRISHEVIKSIDPQAFVCIGGIGYTSYLDVICRLTDNPNGGVPTTKYPKKGGAYFDCLSYHSYPHIEGATRAWSNQINGFRYFRHSDAAVDGVWSKQKEFDFVLRKYGYDGQQLPEKQWIITEINIPRRAFGEYIGSDMAQVNFVMKALLLAPAHGIRQMHLYSLADDQPAAEATSEFSFMGLFQNLNNVQPADARPNQVAIAHKTTSEMLRGKTYDAAQTERLRLPPDVRGAAFRDADGRHIYALWAATKTDRDESAAATYKFPDELKIKYLRQFYWHHSKSGAAHLVNAQQLKLDGSPAFFVEAEVFEKDYPKSPKVFPNPVADSFAVYSFWLEKPGSVTVEVFDSKGKLAQTLLANDPRPAGAHQILLDWVQLGAGTYYVRLLAEGVNRVIPVVKI
ncbi:MAG: T9SS type A sorting domain-containing protein [Saprospiraceae bacterium]